MCCPVHRVFRSCTCMGRVVGVAQVTLYPRQGFTPPGLGNSCSILE